MYTIQANPSGTRSIEVSYENLRTIEKYALFLLFFRFRTGEPGKIKLDELLQAECLHIIVINHVDTKVQQVFTVYLTWLSNTEAEEEEE